MASLFAQPGNGMLFLGGQKISGADVRDQNGVVAPYFPRMQHAADAAADNAPSLTGPR